MPCINTILSVIYFFIIISLLLFCTTATDCHFNCIVLLVQLLGLIHLYLQGQLGYGEVMQYCTECIFMFHSASLRSLHHNLQH